MSAFQVLDLFSGVGAYSLGLERTGGFKTVAFCEIEKFPRKILKKHWLDVPTYEDVKTLTGDRLRADGIVPDWIVAGWPCQGNSTAGTGLGMDDPRSGLWSEIVRLAGEIRPFGLLLENSSNLLNINEGRDFGRVLRDLAALGYDAEWHCLSAAGFDASYIRDRCWIVGLSADADLSRTPFNRTIRLRTPLTLVGVEGDSGIVADPDDVSNTRRLDIRENSSQAARCESKNPEKGKASYGKRFWTEPDTGRETSPNPDIFSSIGAAIARLERHSWEPEPDVARVVSRSPDRLDGTSAIRINRIKALGNLNPPIIPETIGRAILSVLEG